MSERDRLATEVQLAINVSSADNCRVCVDCSYLIADALLAAGLTMPAPEAAYERGRSGWIEWSVEVDWHGNLIRDLFLSREDAEKHRAEIVADDPVARAWLVSRFISDWTRHD